jgi:hypothetical protein
VVDRKKRTDSSDFIWQPENFVLVFEKKLFFIPESVFKIDLFFGKKPVGAIFLKIRIDADQCLNEIDDCEFSGEGRLQNRSRQFPQGAPGGSCAGTRRGAPAVERETV